MYGLSVAVGFEEWDKNKIKRGSLCTQLLLTPVQEYTLDTMVSYLLVLPLLVALTSAEECPCTFNSDLGEVSCDPDTQDTLPWTLPPCLSTITGDQVSKIQIASFPELVILSRCVDWTWLDKISLK